MAVSQQDVAVGATGRSAECRVWTGLPLGAGWGWWWQCSACATVNTHARARLRAAGLLWTIDQLVAVAATYTTHNQHMNIFMYLAALEPAIPAIYRLQPTYTQTARPPASPIWYSYWTVLTARLLRSSRVREVRIKNKDFLGHAMKAYAGSRSIAPSSTHPYPRYWVQVSCQLHAPVALLPWKDPLYPFHRSLGEPRAGLDVFEKRKISCIWWHSKPVPTALPRLPLHDRVYHSPSSFAATDRSLLHCRLVCAYVMTTSGKRGNEFICTYYKFAASWRWAVSTVVRARQLFERGEQSICLWGKSIPHCPSVITSKLTLAHSLVKSLVPTAIKINTAIFWRRGAAKVYRQAPTFRRYLQPPSSG
jgi:hypothetical protein